MCQWPRCPSHRHRGLSTEPVLPDGPVARRGSPPHTAPSASWVGLFVHWRNGRATTRLPRVSEEPQPVLPRTDESRISRLAVSDPAVLVLAEGSTPSAVSNLRGHLFERFVAHLLHLYGYSRPTTMSLNESADGIELDVVATHRLTGQPAIAECKAYSSPVSAASLGTFHSKLIVRRYEDNRTHGFFVAIPRLTAQGREQAELIASNDSDFTLLTALGIVDALKDRGEIVECPVPNILISDPAVAITDEGVFSACLELEPQTRNPTRLLAWSSGAPVPHSVLELLSANPYAQGAVAHDARNLEARAEILGAVEVSPIIATVTGSRSDFEYQLPAAPKYFVGRRGIVKLLDEALDARPGVLVLNAKSGWGKSSLALRLERLVLDRSGHALVLDTRTANSRRYVTKVLRRAANEAAEKNLLRLRPDASWASLASALRTLSEAEWLGKNPIVVFFDQFENVFRNEELTREFRDLALGARELSDRLLVGFAWKTDHVGWTESYPYHMRDEIRAGATVVPIAPLGAAEVDTLLRRLENAIGQSLARDLRQRLREYSQGLPWLFKKLAGHLLSEIAAGATQERLASEGLNVQNLFDADLAEISPAEQEALRHIARYAPIAIGEVEERVPGHVVQSLVNRRLIVQVGEKLDTYWDIFRDYLNNGRIPVEDSYILRQTPLSVARLLREVAIDDGNGNIPDIARRLGTSENALFNLSRELRLLGATTYEPNQVRIIDEIWTADDPERELRRRVASSLRRHRAFSSFSSLSERMGKITVGNLARELPAAFPAVAVAEATWQTYARAFLLWFEYAGLATQDTQLWQPAPDGTEGVGQLLQARIRRRLRGAFPNEAPGPALSLLLEIARSPHQEVQGGVSRSRRGGVRHLLAIGAISELPDGTLRLLRRDLVDNGSVVPRVLYDLLSNVPGVPVALNFLQSNPGASPQDVGDVLRVAVNAEWSDPTVLSNGKYMRGWAKAAGVAVVPVPRLGQSASRPAASGVETLDFGPTFPVPEPRVHPLRPGLPG
ncbi:restriction endonuclease [Micromonospora arida]|uniref:nSTAND1 domain-containing NTPase n=1 Tax=Micromonospora arida TaxID=2203715 RepID=UPI0026C54FB5